MNESDLLTKSALSYVFNKVVLAPSLGLESLLKLSPSSEELGFVVADIVECFNWRALFFLGGFLATMNAQL